MKAYIVKVQAKTKSGYLKAIRDNGFSLTQDIKSAKKYNANEPEIHNWIMYDIDMINRFDYTAVCTYDIVSDGLHLRTDAVLLETVWFTASKNHLPYCVGGIVEKRGKKYFLDNFGIQQLIQSNGMRVEPDPSTHGLCLMAMLGDEVAHAKMYINTKYDRDGMTGELKAKLYARDKRYTFVERAKVKEFLERL